MTPSRTGARSSETSGLRLDVFLKKAGILKRRFLAQSFCAAGAVTVNGHPAKSSRLIYSGDRIRIDTWNRWLAVLVHSLPGKGSGQGKRCYEVIEEGRKPFPND